MIQAIKTFIILHPLETMVTLILICTWTGSYLESVFKFWNWGPQCNKCNEWVFWSDAKIRCIKCDNHRTNDKWQEGYDHACHINYYE